MVTDAIIDGYLITCFVVQPEFINALLPALTVAATKCPVTIPAAPVVDEVLLEEYLVWLVLFNRYACVLRA
jgi:hypothetical protein